MALQKYHNQNIVVLINLRQRMCHSSLCGNNCFPNDLFLQYPDVDCNNAIFISKCCSRGRVSISLRLVETQSTGKDVITELEVKFHLLI